jgi:hypothetical protein
LRPRPDRTQNLTNQDQGEQPTVPEDLTAKSTWVQRVLGVAIPATVTGSAETGDKRAGLRLTQAMMEWNRTRSDVGRQIAQLQDAIISASAEEPDYPAIVDGVGNLEDILSRLDDSLGEKLSGIRMTTDPTEKAKLLQQAKDIVRGIASWAASDPLLADIDTQNGFVTLTIKSSVTQALTTIEQSL